jgi:hypothetical protein
MRATYSEVQPDPTPEPASTTAWDADYQKYTTIADALVMTCCECGGALTDDGICPACDPHLLSPEPASDHCDTCHGAYIPVEMHAPGQCVFCWNDTLSREPIHTASDRYTVRVRNGSAEVYDTKTNTVIHAYNHHFADRAERDAHQLNAITATA